MERSIRKIEPSAPLLKPRKRVAAYARVSLDKETMLESLAAQVGYYSAYIQRNPDWQYVGVYADEGVTGTKSARSEFQRLIADCFAGKIDMVITKSLSRFSRNTLDMLSILRELKHRGVNVFFERENIYSISGDGELMLTILSSFAQEESRSASENVKWRIRKQFEQGEITGWCQLYGYRITHGTVEIDEARAGVVRRVFRDYLAGKSATAIAKALCAEGIPAEQGGKWVQWTVSEMLRNEKYTGNQLLQKSFTVDHLTKREKRNNGELPQYYVEGSHPAIIDIATFARVQEIMERRSAECSRPKPNMDVHPFRLKIVCATCGRHFLRRNTNGTPGYVCTTYSINGKDACLSKKIPETVLLALSAEVLGLSEFNPDMFERKIDHVEADYPNRLTFVFRDGHTVERTWADRSRAESWTPEMREAARQRTKVRKEIERRGGGE